ncbi:MAG: hypothetical protein H6822_11430 [Planctomycetaceae bacterium]|nr:hypothetical protein [Planctomycetales bacterium]MCB9922786.1 hypothetical protein [Planctomycetaceae bacterium]
MSNDDSSLSSATEAIAAEREDSTSTTAGTEQDPSERFLLLTRDGPLVVEVVLRIDGEPYTRALEQLVEQAMHDLNEGDPEGLTWEAAIENPNFAFGQYGNLASEDADQKRQLIEMYDTNRDGLVNRDELPRFLTRNVGGSRAFSLRSSNEFRGDNRTRSHVRRLLDADHDGAITIEEMQAAPQRLFERDADDDEILVLADFKDSVEQTQPQMSNQRRVNAPDTAILISERTRWSYVSYALQETYAYGERVQANDMPLTPELVTLLDENNNAFIDSNEVSTLAKVPPHLILEVAFSNSDDAAMPKPPSIKILAASETLTSVLDTTRQDTSHLSFRLPGADVKFFVNEDPSLANVSQTVSAQFSSLDADNNGYLESDEYPGQLLAIQIPFEGIDRDGDGKIYENEVRALVRQRQAAIRAQIRARAADQEDALYTALDTNGDGRLTAREIYGAPRILHDLDENEDGKLQSHEIPGTMAVGFVRGDANQDNALLVMPAIPIRGDVESIPTWFLGMDTNGDGDISPREFLGASDKFERLDKDEDGFVSADEAKRLLAE